MEYSHPLCEESGVEKFHLSEQGFTLGTRGLHAAHPDSRPKAVKTSGLHEVSEVLVASDLWFQPSFPSQNLTLELSQRCDSWSNQFYLCYT